MKNDILTSRERVNLALAHREADRIPRLDKFWPETLSAWIEQGMDPDGDIHETLDFDIVRVGLTDHEARPGVREVIEESDEWITHKDGNGAFLRYWKNKSGVPEHVGFTVDSRDTWQDLKKELLAVPIRDRVDADDVLGKTRTARRNGRWVCWRGHESFSTATDVVGHETLCHAMADDPEWARDIIDTEMDVIIEALDYLESRGASYDGGWTFGDMAFNHGPFFSPDMYRDLVRPSHARLVSWFKDRGLPFIFHTDGDFRPLIPQMLEIGVDCLQPLEAKAGIDVRELKSRYGDRASFMGNIDVTVLSTGDRERIEEEVGGKISMAKRGGGYIYHSDHSVPPGVTWETYRFVMELVEEYGAYG